MKKMMIVLRKLLQLSICTAVMLFSIPALAGSFTCYGIIDSDIGECGPIIKEVVTEEFTIKYPNKSHVIMVISGSIQYQNGSSSGFATVWFARAKNLTVATVPVKVFSRHFSDTAVRAESAILENEKWAIKNAVSDMMTFMAPTK